MILSLLNPYIYHTPSRASYPFLLNTRKSLDNVSYLVAKYHFQIFHAYRYWGNENGRVTRCQ